MENGAVIILKRDTGQEVLQLTAMVGSSNFYDDAAGQVNGAVSIRNAGSSLKPLLYALAIDQYNYRPNTILEDRDITLPTGSGETYRPRNYDLSYWGSLTLREALGASRNIPAIAMVQKIGIPNFYRFLKKAGFGHIKEGPSHFGPGIALGTAGASLLELTVAYGAFINGGYKLPLLIGSKSNGRGIIIGSRDRIISEETSLKITHILADRDIRRRSTGSRNFLDFPFDVAVKTGTSKDYRDAWTIGYLPEYVVGVWVGNFSGRVMKRVSGAWGSGRVFQQVIRLLAGRDRPRFQYPGEFREVTVCRITGKIAREGCPTCMELINRNSPISAVCDGSHGEETTGYNPNREPLVVSPVHGETYIIDPLRGRAGQQVPLKISFAPGSEAQSRYYFSVNNSKREHLRGSFERLLSLKRGDHEVVIYRDGGIFQCVVFSVR